MSNYAIRRQLREMLRDKRNANGDHSRARMRLDAAWLNAELDRLGITDQRRATWGS